MEEKENVLWKLSYLSDSDGGSNEIILDQDLELCDSPTMESKEELPPEEQVPDRGLSPIPESTSAVLTQSSITQSKDEHMEEVHDDDRGISPIPGTSEIQTQYSTMESKDDEHMEKVLDRGHSPVPGTSEFVITRSSDDDTEINNLDHHPNLTTAPVRSFYEFPTVMPNPEQNSFLSLNETINMVVIENSSKPPSCNDVMNSLNLDRTFFDQRNESQKKYAATYSLKSDTENANGKLK